MPRDVFRRHRLLEPANIKLLDLPAEADGGESIIGMVCVDHQRDVWADRLAHRARHVCIFLDAETDLQLHGFEAFGDVASRLFSEIADRIARFATVESGRVSG